MGDGGCLVVLLIFFGDKYAHLGIIVSFLHCALSETGTIAETADGDYDGSRAAPI